MVKKTVEKTAHLRLFQGNITEGCPTIELIIYQGKDEIERRTARLPQNSELYESLQSFLSHEYELPTRSSRHTMPRSVQTNPEHNLTNKFNDWLKSEDFKEMKYLFLYHARGFDGLIIECNQLEIKRLPWSSWEIIRTYCPNIVVSYTS
jgi:hypothetical protein